MLGLVYHLKAAQLFSKRCYLFAFGSLFLMDIWSQLQFCWSGPLGRIPALSNAAAVPVAGDCHWDYWVSR